MNKYTGFSKKIVILVILLGLIFMIGSFILHWKNGTDVSDVESTTWFGFIGVELLSLASIKKKKINCEKGDGNDV